MNSAGIMFPTTVTGFAQDRPLRKRQEKAFTGRFPDGSTESLEEEMRNYTLNAVRLQRTLGLDVQDAARSDYPDEIGTMARTFAGFQLDLSAGGMSRHTITNTYISKPSVSGTVKFQPDTNQLVRALSALMDAEAGNNGNKLKISIPGIYTLAARAMKTDSKNFDSLLESLLPAYNDALTTFQTPFVQFNEYELLKNATIDNVERMKSIYQRVSCPGKKIMAFYYGDVGLIAGHLDEIPVDIVHVDVFYGTNSTHLLRSAPRRKEIVLGLLDSVQYRGDDEDSAIRLVKQLAERVEPENLWLSTNGDLVYRGRSFAESKIKALVRIAGALRS